jgi:uncharacterized protein (TIGR03086 family)
MTTTTAAAQHAVQGEPQILTQIDLAIRITGAVVEAIGDDQWTQPTPCPDWDVRAVTNHLVGGLRLFAQALAGGVGFSEGDVDWLDDDPKHAYREAARVVGAAWHDTGALDQTLTISLGPVPGQLAAVIHLTELVVHGVDLAVATEHEHLVDQSLCSELLGLMEAMGGIDAFRLPDVFGAAVPAPADLSAHLRLLAYVGRSI